MCNKISRLWLLILLVLFSLTYTTINAPLQAGSPTVPRAEQSTPFPSPRATDPAIAQDSQFPAPPPTARIAFVATGWSVHNADSEIFVMNPDGTGITSISNSPGSDIEPNWSPEG